MTRWTYAVLLLVVVMSLAVVGCGSSSDEGTGADRTTPEEAARAWVQCMREQGVPYGEPVVDASGLVDLPPFPTEVDAGASAPAFDACESLIEGVTFGTPKEDLGDTVADYERLAVCLRDRGYEVSDPTSASVERWISDLKDSLQASAALEAAFDACWSESTADGSKGKP